MAIITTSRLTLRPVRLSDADNIQAYFNDWEIIKWLRPPVPWPYPADGAITHLRALAEKPAFKSFAIRQHGSETVIGTIRYECHEEDGMYYAERGFVLGREYWGQGLMQEAADALNVHIFTTTEATRIRASNALGNLASRRIKERQGFTLIDTITVTPPYHIGIDREEVWHLEKAH